MKRVPEARQLPLVLPHEEAMGRADFVAGAANRTALALIEAWPDWPVPVVLLTGPAGSGKSHLVRIWREASGAQIVPAARLGEADPLRLAATPAVGVEDADRTEAAAPLFHLLNAARASGASVLVTARQAPPSWPGMVPDLASRLRAAAPAPLGEPDDELLAGVLVKLLADRQIEVDPAVLSYLTARMERSLTAARALVDAIDGESLARRRPVTRAVAAAALARVENRVEEGG